MLACAIAYAMLLFGVRTKLAQILSLVCVVSLHARTSFVNNGGDVVLGELALLTAFLPTGRRFSLDTLRSASDAQTADSPTLPGGARANRVVSLAVLVLTLELAVIYLFNALNKTGPTWREGSVVHYMLHQDGIVTSLGHWLRNHVGLRESRVMTYASWTMEAAIPILLFAPVFRRFARRLAVIFVFALHAGFALFLNLGVFAPTMLAFAVHFVPGEDWDALERLWARRSAALPRLRERIEGLRVLLLPLARRWTPPIEPAASKRRPRRVLAREIGVGVVGCLLGFQVLIENPAVTKLSPDLQPTFLRAAVSYFHALQAWGMYAPDAPTTDTNIYVDAITVDGRRVDPFNEVASPNHPAPGRSIPGRLGQDNLFYAYALRIPWVPEYHRPLGEWILRYPERTGRSRDRIVSFEVFFVEDDSPPPGQREPRNVRVKRILKYPEG